MQRRNFVATIGTTGTVLIAGCSGGSGSGNSGNDNGGSGQEFEISYEGMSLFASFPEDASIQGFQVLSSDGAQIGSAQVTGATTRVELLESAPETLSKHIQEKSEVAALDSEGEVIGRQPLTYSPDITISELNWGAGYSRGVGSDSMDIVINNVGKSPVQPEGDRNLGSNLTATFTNDSSVPLAKWDYSGIKERRDSELGVITINEDTLPSLGKDRSKESMTARQIRMGAYTKIPAGESKSISFDVTSSSEGKSLTSTEIIQLTDEVNNLEDLPEPQDINQKFTLSGKIELPLVNSENVIEKTLDVAFSGYNTKLVNDGLQEDYVRMAYVPKEIQLTGQSEISIKQES